MVLLLGSVRQEAKENDFLAENEETGKEFSQKDARNPERLSLGEISRGSTQWTETGDGGWEGGFTGLVTQLLVFCQAQVWRVTGGGSRGQDLGSQGEHDSWGV